MINLIIRPNLYTWKEKKHHKVYFTLAPVCLIFIPLIQNYLLQSERCSVSSLFSTKESVIKISRGVVAKTARIHWEKKS